jgi:hypothetical protein
MASKATDALLGLLVRRILSLNDHVVVSELRTERLTRATGGIFDP